MGEGIKQAKTIIENELQLTAHGIIHHLQLCVDEYEQLEAEIKDMQDQLDQANEWKKNDWSGIERLCDYIDKKLVPSPWRDGGIRLRNISRQLRALAEMVMRDRGLV